MKKPQIWPGSTQKMKLIDGQIFNASYGLSSFGVTFLRAGKLTLTRLLLYIQYMRKNDVLMTVWCNKMLLFLIVFSCTAEREAGVWGHSLAGPFPPHLIFHLPTTSQTPCWWWLGLSCWLWNGLQAAWPSSPPELRDWGAASRETAGTSGPTLSSSWPTTRMWSWVGCLFACV